MVILPACLPPSPSIDTHTDTLRELSACRSGSVARRRPPRPDWAAEARRLTAADEGGRRH